MRSCRSAVVIGAAVACAGLAVPVLASAAASGLTRNPYLTDVSATSVRVNWATTATGTANTVTWGVDGSSCNQFSALASASSFIVATTTETMWTARLGNLSPSTRYCYKIVDSTQSALAGPIAFSTLPSAGSPAPFSFDVIGDTGYNGNGGSNPDQDQLYAEMAGSGASFVLTTGDMAYPDGSQTAYGDLTATGPNVSTEFGPTGWPVLGGSHPAFPVLGNHGRTATFLQNWPVGDAVLGSGGTYAMVNYPGQSGAATGSYPTAYYAFDVGQARFYVLDADWTDNNVGTTTAYGQDYLNHWAPGAAEYGWLKADLAAHPGGLKFAVFHYPLHSDNATEATDTALDGSSSLEGLLASSGVDIVFNGHAHMYQRNNPSLGGMVSYVTGGGGATLEPTGGLGCSSLDAYSIGWSPTSNTGSRCGTANLPTSASQVYHFLHVTVSGATVTVSPENALGQTFDVVSYQFLHSPAPTTTALRPSADTYVYQGAPSANYGSVTPLLASAGSYRSLLRFDTSGIDPASTITSVTLRVYSTVGLASGGAQVHAVGDAWDEATATWLNQPAWNTSVLATSATPTAAGWLSIPLPPASIVAGGHTDLALGYSVSGIIERLSSREDPSNPPLLLVTTAPTPTTTTLNPTADTYLYQGAPTTNYGAVTPLLMSAAAYRALLRFDTSWLEPGTAIDSVTLRLYATIGLASGGIRVHPAADSWTEATTTWSTQPSWNSQTLATSATQSAPGWISIALPTSALTAGGNTSFGLDYSVAQTIERITSREDSTNPPQLLITTH